MTVDDAKKIAHGLNEPTHQSLATTPTPSTGLREFVRTDSPFALGLSRVDGQFGFIQPQLFTSVDQPPQGDEWLHEIKHNGYRILLVVEGKHARAYTRGASDFEALRSAIRWNPHKLVFGARSDCFQPNEKRVGPCGVLS
jgi:hypothetical protein